MVHARALYRSLLRVVSLDRQEHAQRGQMLPLMALVLGMTLVGGVLVVDIGLLFDERRQAQGAADFAALAAAQELPRSSADPNAAAKMASAEATALDYLQWNGYDTLDPGVTATISTNYLGAVDKIEVVVRKPRSWLFGGVFGLGEITVAGRSVAAANALPRDVLVTLDRSGSMCYGSHPSGGCSGWSWVEEETSSSSPNPLTEPIEAAAGHMVVVGYTAGNVGTYTANNGFTIGLEQVINGTMTAAAAHKLSADGTETISLTHSGPNRQQLVGMTLPSSGPNVALIGGWQSGLLNHVAPAGAARRLVFIANWEDEGGADLNCVRYGGQDLTRVGKDEVGSGTRAGVEMWVLEEAGIALAASNDFTVSWDETVNHLAYGHAFFDNVGQGPGWEPFDTMRYAADAFTENFLPTVEGVPFDYIGLASYANTATLDEGLTLDYVAAGNVFDTALWALSPSGRTNIGHAIYVARTELGPNGHLGSAQVIVLLTDGLANRYRSGGTDESPIFSNCSSTPCNAADDYARAEAQAAADVGIAIYTIGLTGGAGEALLQDIAQIGAVSGGGGQFFDVDDPADLNGTFSQIAELLNYALIE